MVKVGQPEKYRPHFGAASTARDPIGPYEKHNQKNRVWLMVSCAYHVDWYFRVCGVLKIFIL